MQHTIELTVKRNEVRAEPNPLPNVAPGDTVLFDVTAVPSGLRPRDLEVEFHEVRVPCGPQGPFAFPLTGMTGRVAKGQGGLYIYRVFAVTGGPHGPLRTPLNWVNGLEPGGNFGGINVPRPPPDKP